MWIHFYQKKGSFPPIIRPCGHFLIWLGSLLPPGILHLGKLRKGLPKIGEFVLRQYRLFQLNPSCWRVTKIQSEISIHIYVFMFLIYMNAISKLRVPFKILALTGHTGHEIWWKSFSFLKRLIASDCQVHDVRLFEASKWPVEYTDPMKFKSDLVRESDGYSHLSNRL